MNLYKSVGLTISIMLFCSVMLMSQSRPNRGYIQITEKGDTILVKEQNQGSQNNFKSKKQKGKTEYLTITDLTYEEAKAKRDQYKKEGWTYDGMEKQKDGKWTIYFSRGNQ